MNIFQIWREFPKAAEYIDFNELERGRWVESVAKELPAGTHILDVGAGPGRYRKLFAHCKYEAHDFAQYEGTAEGIHKDEWSYTPLDYTSDITAIPVPDGSFDAILCTEVLEHVPEPIKALQEMGRILRTGGKLFLSAPLGSGLHQEPYHFYGGYTPHFYRLFLDQFGFDVLEIKPNRGFFSHYLQESARAARLLIQKKQLSRFSLYRLLIGFIFLRLIPVVFYHYDEKYFVPEHTVGFFVTATKR